MSSMPHSVRNNPAYTSRRIGSISGASWNEMNVSMHYSLARDHTAVNANIETKDDGSFRSHSGNDGFGVRRLAGALVSEFLILS